MSRQEHQVVVVLDVTASSRKAAAEALAFVLGEDGILDDLRLRVSLALGDRGYVELESWWFPEADLKHIDHNDNAPMHLEHDEDHRASEFPMVVVTCGRSQVHGNLMRQDDSAWYVRHEGAPFAKQYRKDEWTLTRLQAVAE